MKFDHSGSQWYCLEADELGDAMLAVAKILFSTHGEDNTIKVSPLHFLPSATKVKNASQMSAFSTFVKYLRNVGVQLGASTMLLELQNYDERAVNDLEAIGFRESGGFWSSEFNCLIHQFTVQNCEAPMTVFTEETFNIEQDDNIAMESLVESLFTALHKEQSCENLKVLSSEPTDGKEIDNSMASLMETLFAALHKELDNENQEVTRTSANH